MKDDLVKIKFVAEILALFYKQKNMILQALLEDLNSSPTPEIRFFKAELRRLAMFEERFLTLMESQDDPLLEISTKNSQNIFSILIGNKDF